MIVGFMRNFKNPTAMAELTAKVCKYYDIDIIYLRPRDVNIEKGIVRGRMFISNKWIRVRTNVPKLIDISPYCFKIKNREIMKYLRDNTYLTDDRTNTINKEKLQECLENDCDFSDFAIPTSKIEAFKDIQ